MQILSENNGSEEPKINGDCDKREKRVDGGVRVELQNGVEQTERGELFDFSIEKRILDCLAEFAAGAGHEINNPLAIIRGRAEKLLREETSPQKRRELAVIVEQTRRAFEMIADVRLFARPPQPKFSEFSLKTFFQDWVDREKKRLEEVDAPIETQVCGDFTDFSDYCEGNEGKRSESIDDADVKNGAIIKSDLEMLAAILSALGKNAAEAAATGGRLAFFCEIRDVERRDGESGKETNVRRIERNGKIGIIGVENDGSELSDEERRLVFSPFFSGRQAGRGLGFGLPKSWRFAEALGVNLRCEKAKTFDSGTRWSVSLTLR